MNDLLFVLVESYDSEIINQIIQSEEAQTIIAWVLAIFASGTVSITIIAGLIYRFIKRKSSNKIASEIVNPIIDSLVSIIGKDNTKLLKNLMTNLFNNYGTSGLIEKAAEWIGLLPSLKKYIYLDLQKSISLGVFDQEGLEDAKVVAVNLVKELSKTV